MATLNIRGSNLGSGLTSILMADDIEPGSEPSYALCKAIYLLHPLGAKLAESPISMAQSQPRTIAVTRGPKERVRQAFLAEWKAIDADKIIFQLMTLSRVYGIATIALLEEGKDSGEPVDFETLWRSDIGFNVLDPLNTAGSLVGNLNPNSIGFLKTTDIAVAGKAYHRSRSIIKANEQPIYLGYTVSAYGYVGRSVYQRTLFPLKSFVQTMVTDDMVSKKAGIIVAMMKQASSIVDNVQQLLFARKREVVKDAETGQIIGIGIDEKIESLQLRNVNDAMDASRKHILENIASGADMPAQLLNAETFAEGFGEGTEDAKAVARYIDRVRQDMEPIYAFMDRIVQHRAWNPEFYERLKADFPEYRNKPFAQAFYEWRNSFTAEWPSLLTEPPSERIKVDDVRLKAIIALVEVLLPAMDPENRATVIEWACDNFNTLSLLFEAPLNLELDLLAAYEVPKPEMDAEHEPQEPKPFAAADADLPPAWRRRERRRAARAAEDLTAALGRFQSDPAIAGIAKLAGLARTHAAA